MDPLPHLSRVSGIMEEVLYFKSMSTLMAWFRLALVVPSATMLPELQATFRAFSTARPSLLIQGFVIRHWWCFSSHQHSPCIFLMCADMDSAYSTTCVWWLSMAAALNMSQSVHSNSSCNVSMASAGQTLTCFTVGFFLISRCLYAGINITERWARPGPVCPPSWLQNPHTDGGEKTQFERWLD